MDQAMEDTKPDVDIDIKEEDEMQPDPDEALVIETVGKAWVVKVPKHLMESWREIEIGDLHLATMRIYEPDPRTGKRRHVLLVPNTAPDPDNPRAKEIPTFLPGTYDEYELDTVNDAVDNQLVITEREKEGEPTTSRARRANLTARVKRECNMRPNLTDSYRSILKGRVKVANTPKRTAEMIATKDAAAEGRMNRINSGMAAQASTFSNLVKAKPKPQKGTFERFARIPRNQLLDMLFQLYREQPRWTAKDLRARTEQPEAYLKEVLADVADLHRSGEFNGTYELKAIFKDSVKSEGGTSLAATGAMKAENDVDEDDEEDYDEDEDDDDMEEIS